MMNSLKKKKITGDFFLQTLEVNADLQLNGGRDAKFLSDLSSHIIQYEGKLAQIPDLMQIEGARHCDL